MTNFDYDNLKLELEQLSRKIDKTIPLVLILGPKFDVSEKVKKRGHQILVIDNKLVLNHHQDTIYLPGIQTIVDKVPIEWFSFLSSLNVVGVLPCFEVYVELAAQIKFNFLPHLIGPTPTEIKQIRDKVFLKSLLHKTGIPTTRITESISHFSVVISQLGLPFIIKPRRGLLAQGITKISNEIDYKNWVDTNPDFNEFYAEEYIDDLTEFCCDTIVRSGEVIATFAGQYSVPCLQSNKEHCGFGVDFPGFAGAPIEEELKRLATEFVKGFGIKNGYCHIEFLYNPHRGLLLGECGLRLPGSYQVPAESYLYSASVLDEFIDIFLDTPQQPSFAKPERKYCGYYLYPMQAATVTSIKTMPMPEWILSWQIYVAPGQSFEHEDSSISTAAYVMYRADSIADLKANALAARSLIQIQWAPKDTAN